MSQLRYALRQRKITCYFFFLSVLLLGACSPTEKSTTTTDERLDYKDGGERLEGVWGADSNGRAMQDPQTSGLAAWRGKLLSISDRSAVLKQRLTIHVIDPKTGQLQGTGFPNRRRLYDVIVTCM
jgi:hypothetical protein